MGRPLYELAGLYKRLAETVDEGEVVGDAQLAELGAEVEQKGIGVAYVLQMLDDDEAALKAEIDRLTARKKALVANRERLRETVKRSMVDHGITRIKAGTFSISVYDGPLRVDVTDIEKVPQEYLRIKTIVEVDKVKVLEAYDNGRGECISGTDVARSVCLRIR